MFPIQLIHPAIVHFPIVFFLTLAAFDVVGLVRGATIFGRGCAAHISAGLAVLAGLSAIVAYTFGDIAADMAVSSGIPESQLETHETLGTVTAIFLAVWALARGYAWWRDMPLEGGKRSAAVIIEACGALLVITTAYFGGHLVYDLGVNVARFTS